MARESNETRVHCLTSHLTSFAGQFYVAPNKIDFDDVFNKISSLPPENMFVLFTVCLMFACYAVGLVFARKADNRDKMKVKWAKTFRFHTLRWLAIFSSNFQHLYFNGTILPLCITIPSFFRLFLRCQYNNVLTSQKRASDWLKILRRFCWAPVIKNKFKVSRQKRPEM